MILSPEYGQIIIRHLQDGNVLLLGARRRRQPGLRGRRGQQLGRAAGRRRRSAARGLRRRLRLRRAVRHVPAERAAPVRHVVQRADAGSAPMPGQRDPAGQLRRVPGLPDPSAAPPSPAAGVVPGPLQLPRRRLLLVALEPVLDVHRHVPAPARGQARLRREGSAAGPVHGRRQLLVLIAARRQSSSARNSGCKVSARR